MRHLYESEIRQLLPHLRRGLMDGTRSYRDQEFDVQRQDMSRRNPGQYRDNLVRGPETKHGTKGNW